MSLRTQFKSLLEPELMEGFVTKTVSLKVVHETTEDRIELGPFPSWFTIYEIKLALWNKMGRNPIFCPPLVFLGIPRVTEDSKTYTPVEMVWKDLITGQQIPLTSPFTMMIGSPHPRFVDSAGTQKAVGKDNRTRMTLNDIFQLDEGKEIPEIHVFLFSDLVDKIVGPRPLGDRDIYGRILPYFPFLDPLTIPAATGEGVATPILTAQAEQTMMALKQITYLEELLVSLGGELQLPKLDGVKFLRWVWNQVPAGWEGSAILFFGTKVTHDRPYMRFFSSSGQPLTKIRVKGILPIPDLPDPNLLMIWKQDKNPDMGKDCTFLKLRVQDLDGRDSMPLYATMRVFNDGTSDLLIMPPKQKRLLDPYSDLQDAPDILERSFADLPYTGLQPILGQADVVFKIRLERSEAPLTKAILQRRLKYFSSVFQEIPPLPDEQPLAMLRYKGVSNFNSEDRIFAFLTQLAAHEMVDGEAQDETWAPRVSREFQLPIDEARRHVVAWIAQKNEYALAVPETKDYILNKNPGVDIAIFAQHPIYNFHMYRAQSFDIYRTIVNLLGILMTAPADRFVAAPAAAATLAPVEPVVSERSPAADGVELAAGAAVNGLNASGPANAAPGAEAYFPDNDGLGLFPGAENYTSMFPNGEPNATSMFPNGAPEEADAAAMFPNGAPEEGDATPPALAQAPPATAAPATAAPAQAPAQVNAEDKLAATAFKKPTDLKAIAVSKYYIDKLKLADPELFNYAKVGSERGYVSHCAANESRQPIVLDTEEYREMRSIYDADGDMDFVVYPEDPSPKKFPKKQPSKDENVAGRLEGRPYPSDDEKEIITLVRYGSKAKRINYYFCPRLFCIRDRLMVRQKDFKAAVDRDGKPKPANSCPFCKGILVNLDGIKDKDRDPNMTVLQRKTRPASETERQIYIGFLNNKKTPTGLSLPCCFADPSDRFDVNDPEFVRLGLRAGKVVQAAQTAKVPLPKVPLPKVPLPKVPVVAQAVADTVMGMNVLEHLNKTEAPTAEVAQADQPAARQDELRGYEPNYFRVIQGVSVKSIVDAGRIPLEIIVPKATALDDPKAGPQIGLLPETLDKFFMQDSTSDKFADRLEIVRKLKPTAKGFLRLAIDNTPKNRNLSALSAVAPFLKYRASGQKVINELVDMLITPRHFLQLNAGNLVHEFFNKCEKKQQNDMRSWVAQFVGVDEISSSNIPAIERLMNSYECFKTYLHDPSQRKDLRIFYQAFSEPGVISMRGILFIVLEVTIEEVSVKLADKVEYKREVKFEKVRCPPYPLSEGQQKADIGFLVHYSSVTRDRYHPERKTYKSVGWETLFYVDGTIPTPDSRHKPTLFFQRSQEASWPPIVQKRVSEFFGSCSSVNRGPFTSQFAMDPNALIGAQEIITAVRIQPNGIIRDAYNHLVGVAYRLQKSGIAAIPVADDGSIHFQRRIFLDWDDFHPAPADEIIEFFNEQIINIFPQYRGYVPKYLQKSRDTDKIIGVTLQNGFAIPASEPTDPESISKYRVVPVDDLEWDINRTIAYDDELRKAAFKDADEKDPDANKHVQLKVSSIQDEIEDVYQHLRLSFSNWLATAGAGGDMRDALKEILKRSDLPLYEKRKRLDILLEDRITRWMEPRQSDDMSSGEIGFLRVDCIVQGEDQCSGRCKWSSDESVCKVHTPATFNPNGVILNVPRMLYLRLVDELIRYASRREEIFTRQVPRLTIRKEAQRQGDQYIIPEGSPDWNTWWERLRTEWMTPEKEEAKFFDEQYDPIPSGLPGDDTRILPDILRDTLGAEDPKTSRLVWNPSTTEGRPFAFLKSILRNHPVTTKNDDELDTEELKDITRIANVRGLYLPNGNLSGALRTNQLGAVEIVIIAVIDGVVGWISQRGTYGVKLPLISLPNSLSTFISR